MVILTKKQLEDYSTDGYLILRNNEHSLITPSSLKTWTNEVFAWPSRPGKWMPYNEVSTTGTTQLMRTEKMADYHPQLGALLFSEALGSIVKQISGEEMLLFKDKINYKLPNGNGFHPHLDAPAYDHICEVEHVTANFAVEAATIDNGCLEIVPGSHRVNVQLADGGRISEDWVASHEWLPILLNPGDVLFFGSHLAHRSAPNKTSGRRASLYATYAARSDGEGLREKYYEHRRVAFPPDVEREESVDYEAGWKRYGFAAPFSRHGIANASAAVGS
jgi:hypothetical protein